MKIQKHFVAYVDILGFTNYVKENLPTPERPLDLLQQFIGIAKEMNVSNNLNITAFSDNIVISMLAEEPIPQLSYDLKYWDFISYMNTVQACIITVINKLPIRGAITFGDLYHDKSEVLFGKAFVEAHDLEQLHAYYPRIVVNPKFLDPNTYLAATKVFAHSGLAKNLPVFNFEQLKRQYPVAHDYDGVLYCNYLSSLYFPVRHEWAGNSLSVLKDHKNFVERWLLVTNETNDMSMLRKYTWMKSYHNWFCGPFEEFHKYIIQDR